MNDEATQEKQEVEGEGEDKTASTNDVGDQFQAGSLIERADATRQRLEAAAERAEKAAQRLENLKAYEKLGGKTDGKIEAKKDEEDPREYAKNALMGKMQAK